MHGMHSVPGGHQKEAAGTGPVIDTSEKGAALDGERQTLDERLYMQLLAFGNCIDVTPVAAALEESAIEAVIYEDVNDPRGIALVTMSEDPAFFTSTLRPLLKSEELSTLKLKPEYTMMGRTYALGHEQDLEDWLLRRSRRVIMNPEWPWAIWYPLKRTGEFALLEQKIQAEILMEHATIGRAFGKADLGHDIRLACHGLDKSDNDFVIALIGKKLTPLSILVQTMRKTKQTSAYIKGMGPFFIGRAVWQSGVKQKNP